MLILFQFVYTINSYCRKWNYFAENDISSFQLLDKTIATCYITMTANDENAIPFAQLYTIISHEILCIDLQYISTEFCN